MESIRQVSEFSGTTVNNAYSVGDFNIHHPLWDRHGRESAKAGDLLAIMAEWGLELRTPYGEPTHESREDRDSTIDHAWATPDLTTRWEGHGPHEGSDHRSQILTIGADAPAPQQREGWSWAMMDKTKVEAQAR